MSVLTYPCAALLLCVCSAVGSGPVDACHMPSDAADHSCGTCLGLTGTDCAWCDWQGLGPERRGKCGRAAALAAAGCPPERIVTAADSEQRCRRNVDSIVCQGRGECVCGVCQCAQRPDPAERVYGQYCECDNYSCPRYDRVICAGHGRCECGQCMCDEGHAGYACGCDQSVDRCIGADGKVCSGRGECVCGRCRCDERYAGPTCGVCPTCPQWCMEYKPCVRCQAFGTGLLDEAECAQCPFTVQLVEALPEASTTVTDCQFIDPSDDCQFSFVYHGDVAPGNQSTVLVKADKECPPP